MIRARSAAAVLFLAAALFGCNRSITSPSNQTPVILISIDTLRSDHLPAYGYKGVETPNIDKLRADSILYQRAYSHVPMTLPSHATIFTGMLPGDNGVRDNAGVRLSESVPTLPDLLKKNGYATGGAVSAYVLRRETGIARGFDFFDDATEMMAGGDLLLGRIQRDGRLTLRSAQKWLDAQAGKPFFFFLHLYEPHTPYTPPEPFFSRYRNHYDGEIAYADAIVGDLIAELKKNGDYDNALIILLSDHGEGLNEHGEEEHGMFLYREALQVPLIMKLPKSRKAGASVSVPVQLVDVFPTILERTATPAPKTGHRVGQSLLSFLEGGPTREIYSETYYPKLHFGWSDLHSLIDGDEHFIRAPQAELYNLATDPGEKVNTLEQNRRAYVKLRADIEPFLKEPASPGGYDPEEAAKLAALGYIGSTVETKPGEELPDPKTKRGVYHDIRLAATLFKQNDFEAALRLSTQLLTDNPRLTDMWDLKSKILWAMGAHQASIDAAEEGLRANPHSVALLFDVADLLFATGDFDGARKHAEAAVAFEPGRAHETLGKIAIEQKQFDVAEKEAKLAMQTTLDPSPSLMVLARAESSRGNLASALSYIDQAEARVKQRNPPKLQDVHLTRGDILARMGRNEEAEREFRAEISDFPTDPRAYSSLVMLLATEGRLDEGTKIVFAAIQASPGPHTYAVVAETLKALGDDRGAMYWTQLGQQRFPQNAELRDLPGRLAKARLN